MALRCISSEIMNDFKTNFFIETGTLDGDGIAWALEFGFPNIISIDMVSSASVIKKFENNKNVKLIHGDSGTYLWEAIKDKDQKLTFWLDAHADLIEPEDPIAHKNWNPICPIMEELAQIEKHQIKDHHILIDDITWIIKVPGVSKAKMEAIILKINPNYKIAYIDTGCTQTLIASTNNKDYNDYSIAYDK